jgi:hypothetical protein
MLGDRRARILRSSLLLGLVFIANGCGSSEDRLRVYPLRGELFVKGQPASGASVVLHPRDKEKGRAAFATVQADGTFKLSTYANFDGAAAGEYAVTISWCDERQEEGEIIASADKLGDQYSKHHQTSLATTVQAGKNEPLRFDLP